MVSKLDNGTTFTYEEPVNVNDHLKIHQNANHIKVLIAQINIGAKAK